jgi:hypothetical protein
MGQTFTQVTQVFPDAPCRTVIAEKRYHFQQTVSRDGFRHNSFPLITKFT